MSLTAFLSLPSSPSIILDAHTAALAWIQYNVRSAARHNLRSILGRVFTARQPTDGYALHTAPDALSVHRITHHFFFCAHVSARPFFVLVLWLWSFRGNDEWRPHLWCFVVGFGVGVRLPCAPNFLSLSALAGNTFHSRFYCDDVTVEV
ncbi:hypothetical protein MVEN_00502000 [Mycena venus]|uniref:Uncharacterized protein n=1 Tax=Mycena venus TaxID=2733690 RepID=A0A8H6YXS5_9AGAR|nr:hypothetical protein MVEN_00502000 [Mycena venus]